MSGLDPQNELERTLGAWWPRASEPSRQASRPISMDEGHVPRVVVVQLWIRLLEVRIAVADDRQLRAVLTIGLIDPNSAAAIRGSDVMVVTCPFSRSCAVVISNRTACLTERRQRRQGDHHGYHYRGRDAYARDADRTHPTRRSKRSTAPHRPRETPVRTRGICQFAGGFV